MSARDALEPASARDALERASARRLPLRLLAEEWSAALPRACRALAERFERGGQLVAVSGTTTASDAHHVAVEFVHPVIVGKRALPALAVARAPVPPLRAGDAVLAIAGADEAADLVDTLRSAHARGAYTLALEGGAGDLAKDAAVAVGLRVPSADRLVAQEGFVCAYHLLWEGTHVALESADRRGDGAPIAAAGLYPFLAPHGGGPGDALADLEASVAAKLAEITALRERTLAAESDRLLAAAAAIAARLDAGGRVFAFGNGGSATDADALAACFATPPRGAPRTARSLSADPALLTALANDVGFDAVFARQIDAFARRGDVAVAFTTSGSSRNVTRGLEVARRRGLLTAAFCGYDGGELAARALVDFPFVVPSQSVHRIQEVGTTLHHVLWELAACAS